MAKVDREIERVNANSLMWLLCTLLSIGVMITVMSDGWLHPEKCITPEEAAFGGVVPLVITDGQRNCG